MVGGGAIALCLGIAGYSMGIPQAVLMPIVIISLNFWTFALGDEKSIALDRVRAAAWPVAILAFGGAVALEWVAKLPGGSSP